MASKISCPEVAAIVMQMSQVAAGSAPPLNTNLVTSLPRLDWIQMSLLLLGNDNPTTNDAILLFVTGLV